MIMKFLHKFRIGKKIPPNPPLKGIGKKIPPNPPLKGGRQRKELNFYCAVVSLVSLSGYFSYAPVVMAEGKQIGDRSINVTPTWEIANEYNQENWPSVIKDNQIFWLLLIEELEYRVNDADSSFNWDAHGWVGGDYRRLWLKTDGEVNTEDGEGDAEVQLLYSQLVWSFWEWQAGVRYDRIFGSESDGRAFVVFGLQGLAPYFFEVDAALFVSEDGDISARLSVEYELLITQRLVLQPEFEVNVAAQEVEEFEIGTGFNDLELEMRLRYEFSRRFAPYIGISWERKFAGTADFAREEGESVDEVKFVGGLRLTF